MDLDALKELIEDFDPMAFMPKLDGMAEGIALIMRVCVMAAPICLLALGLLYFFASPKEANYHLGYRCYFGMGSVEAWRFTQKLAGAVLGGVGLILTIVMAVISGKYALMETEPLLTSAVTCLLWELGLAILSFFAINLTAMILFDAKGRRRGQN